MAADIHIDDFYKDIARILLQLYMSFPVRSPVYVDDISGPDEPDEFGLHTARHQSCFGAMVWLSEEGYLRFESTIRQEAIDQAVLTHKAFSILSSTPKKEIIEEINYDTDEEVIPVAVVGNANTNANELRKAINTGSSIIVSEFVSSLLSA